MTLQKIPRESTSSYYSLHTQMIYNQGQYMPTLDTRSLQVLERHALSIRMNIIKMLVAAGSGHSAGPLGLADIFTLLYFGILKHDPEKPTWKERDYLLVSNGHTCPVWYATLAEAGYFKTDELLTLRKLGSRLQGHPHLGSLPGIENTSGPLSQGFSQACGLAKALLMDNKKNQVYVVLSDGEHQEGQIWEAYMFAAKYRLHNLTVLIDRNTIQIDGDTEDIMPLEPLADKLTAFGWHVQEIDGHNFHELYTACETAKAVRHSPSVIICHTIAGKGVEFMEGEYLWHGKPPTAGQAHEAIQELRSLKGKIVWE